MEHGTESKARAAGRAIVWAGLALIAVVAVLAFFLLGPLGVVLALAVGGVLAVLWMGGTFSGGGPAG